MFKNTVLFLLVLSFNCLDAQITLTHNIGTTPIQTDMFSCEEDEVWSRVFYLSDFGILPNEQFIIKSGQIALSKSNDGALLQLSVSSIDEDFPGTINSSYSSKLIGIRGLGRAPIITGAPEIINVDFDEPIVVPAGVNKILVSVSKYAEVYNPASAEVFIAGTATDTGTSWYKGCEDTYIFTSTSDLTTPLPNANFYINVTGEVFDINSLGPTTRLSHNFCDNIVKTMDHSCFSSYTYFARDFNLEDFGISTNEEFVIKTGEVGISYSTWGATVQFNIYKIDDNFPDSFSESNLIGSSQEYQFPYMGSTLRILNVNFETPVVVPADVTRILVEVKKGIASDSSALAHIAGTVQDDGATSWYKGCVVSNYINTDNLGNSSSLWPGEDYNFYINVTGNVNHITNNFEMNISNICSEFLKEFSVEKKSEIASIVWNFGDPASGTENTSIDLSPFHDFSADGTYTITATVTANNGRIEVLTETINVKEPPNAYGIDNIEACEDTFGSGISSSFDTSKILSQVLGNQTDKVVTFIDGIGNEYNQLPNPFTNSVKDRETITVRIARSEELCCYSEITFDLIVNSLPDLSNIEDVLSCDDDNDGFTNFDLTQIQSNLSVNNTNVNFYFQDGQQISDTQLNAVINKVQNQETITARVINTKTNCYNETTFKLIVSPLPVANTLTDLIGCDDNNDGVSEYFNTSNIESQVLGNQTGLEVTYFNSNGNQLPGPLPNPYTNTIANQEIITVRVTNPLTGCFSETFLNLITSSKPQIHQLASLYACNEVNGIAHFDTSGIENQLIGNQTGLVIFYFDENGNKLPSPLPSSYQNSTPWSQTIQVRVENELNTLCYSETSFDMIVNELPQINLEKEYFLCDLEPSLYITTDSNLNSWKWIFENNSVISNSFEANLADAGKYTLQVSKFKNGISCENSFSFNLVRSTLPVIDEIKIQDISDNNYIEIITSGDGDFEYSIDGFNFQDDNIFENLLGGIYNVQVRDKKGCGFDSKEITLIDYPKFFTPNNDGLNDYWQIKGIEKYPNAIIYIFDRFGKLLKQLTFNDLGWDGTYNGKYLFTSDYWFIADLGDGRTFKGHFSLKR